MANEFGRCFGDPEHVLICWGDHSTRSQHLHGITPVPSRHMIDVFTHAGYEVMMVNEQ
jgi:hypothetical protein